jgi:peptidoglycan/xylan/chitin deacetylase (PgdA/CDA1 family)
MRLAKRFVVTMFLACCLAFGGSGFGEDMVPKVSTPMVTFVFDDGFDTDYLIAKPIFDKQAAVACSAVVTDWIDRRGFLSKEQVLGLRDAGWEIMSHTASHPKLRSLKPAQIEEEFSRSREALRGLGINVKNLVYPYNKSNSTVREIARRYYRSARGGENELNREEIDQYDLHSVSNRKLDLEKIEHDVDQAYAERAWLIIHQHKIDSKITLTKKHGRFTRGEQLLFSPSGATGRHLRDEWFLTAGYLHMVVLTGKPRPGDTVTGGTSGATALLNKVVYDQGEEIAELVTYVRTKYPDMRIVTIDTALDVLGEPDLTTQTGAKGNAIEMRVDQKR